MAQVYVSTDGSQIIPGATASVKVQTANSGLAVSGVLMLVGEADAGPDYSLETDLSDNAFGPDQVGTIVAKYKSGPLVDAFKAAAQPLADPNIPGSPNRIVLVKSNPSTKASSTLAKWNSSDYADLADKSYGKLGNLIYYTVDEAQAEVVPTTSSFTWVPSVGTVAVGFRANGAAAVSATLSANATPTSVVSTLNALSGVLATGGSLRTVLPVSGTLTITAPGSNVVSIAYSGTFTTTPSVGDTLTIATGSPIDGGASDENVGAYVVTAATSNSISATKLSDGGKGGAVAGTVTAPIAVGSTSVTASTNFNVYAPVVFALEAADPSDGVGKSLEVAELTTGTDLLSRAAFALSTTAVTWVSKSGTPKLLVSATEYKATLNVARQVDNISEDFTVGGDIGLKISYQGTTASMTIDDDTLTTTVTGGSGANLDIDLADFPTISDLASYINAQTGYLAAPGSSAIGQTLSTALDDGTYGICTQFGQYNGRIKIDAFKFFKKISEESVLVQINDPVLQAGAGLPAPTSATAYLSGGTRGATTAAGFVAAVAALERVQGNFLVPLFSRDATDDIADGLTDSASTYTIDAVHAVCRTHVLAMSKVKRRKNRQAFLSHRGTFSDNKEKAGAMANFRCSMSFLDQKVVASDGTVQQMQPWVDAAIAAGGQAAGFYKALVRKFKNVSGSLQAAGDWSDQDDTQVEDALLAGLLPTRRHDTGGYYFVSDQTTYSKDANFVFNSIQAVYVADTIALTTAKRMEDAFAGQSVADISAAAALTFLEGIMADFMRLKLLAASDDAPSGFKNATITISGPAMIVDLEVKLAGTIYFIPINFLVSQVSQTASQ